MKIKIPKGPPKKNRGTWGRNPITKIKDSGKTYKREKGWGLKEFVDSVDHVMKKQEKEHPPLRQVHARLSPDWKRVSEQIGRFLTLENEQEIENLREEIVSEGEMATRVLLDLILMIKQQAAKGEIPS